MNDLFSELQKSNKSLEFFQYYFIFQMSAIKILNLIIKQKTNIIKIILPTILNKIIFIIFIILNKFFLMQQKILIKPLSNKLKSRIAINNIRNIIKNNTSILKTTNKFQRIKIQIYIQEKFSKSILNYTTNLIIVQNHNDKL